MSEVVSTTIRKIRWIERLTFDQKLTALAVRVGCAIAWHLNRERGDARVGHLTLAEKLGVTKRSIDRAVNELVAEGHLKIERGEPIGYRRDGSAVYGGRGSSSTFRMVFEAIEAPQIRATLRATPVSLFAESEREERATPESLLMGSDAGQERATFSTRKSDSKREKERHQSRTNPYKDPYITRQRYSSPLPALTGHKRKTFGDIGRYMRELGDLILPGGAGFVFLIDHPDVDRITGLCRKLRNGALTEAELLGLQEEARERAGRIDAVASGERS